MQASAHQVGIRPACTRAEQLLSCGLHEREQHAAASSAARGARLTSLSLKKSFTTSGGQFSAGMGASEELQWLQGNLRGGIGQGGAGGGPGCWVGCQWGGAKAGCCRALRQR